MALFLKDSRNNDGTMVYFLSLETQTLDNGLLGVWVIERMYYMYKLACSMDCIN